MMRNYLSSHFSAGFILILAVSLTSCAENKQSARDIKNGSTGTDYSGTYEITDPSVCKLTITISKNNSGYVYTLNAAGVKSAGKLEVEKEGKEVYLNFTATLRSGDKTSVTGMYTDNAIMIQNYGNAMNPYTCFKECDVRYLQLVKNE